MKKTAKARAVIYGILIALIFFEAFDLLGGYDFIKAATFTPSPEMEQVIDNINLTSRGERILKASSPTLDSRDVFNEKCDSHNAEIYVLGCYLTGDDAIHLYNIDSDELDGVIESTAAHELLHAVYNRLPFWEKTSLNNQLKAVYNSLDENDEIKTSMQLYSDDDFYDELHSRLGTEIKNLPYDLEKHYAAIFEDQDTIVDYYERYSGTFKKYESELKELEQKINNLKNDIEAEEARLTNLSNELNIKIDNYNTRVKQRNYTSVEVIRAEGKILQTEIDNINSAYDALNVKINEYNNAIIEYNNKVIRTNQVFDSINSNSMNVNSVSN